MTDAAKLTADLIRCPSVTPQEGGALTLLASLLTAGGFECHRVDRNGPRMRGECRYCGSRIQRIGHRKWRRVPKGAPLDAG